jgi:hypothetical protein
MILIIICFANLFFFTYFFQLFILLVELNVFKQVKHILNFISIPPKFLAFIHFDLSHLFFLLSHCLRVFYFASISIWDLLMILNSCRHLILIIQIWLFVMKRFKKLFIFYSIWHRKLLLLLIISILKLSF